MAVIRQRLIDQGNFFRIKAHDCRRDRVNANRIKTPNDDTCRHGIARKGPVPFTSDDAVDQRELAPLRRLPDHTIFIGVNDGPVEVMESAPNRIVAPPHRFEHVVLEREDAAGIQKKLIDHGTDELNGNKTRGLDAIMKTSDDPLSFRGVDILVPPLLRRAYHEMGQGIFIGGEAHVIF